jgi:hypothetical protein
MPVATPLREIVKVWGIGEEERQQVTKRKTFSSAPYLLNFYKKFLLLYHKTCKNVIFLTEISNPNRNATKIYSHNSKIYGYIQD